MQNSHRLHSHGHSLQEHFLARDFTENAPQQVRIPLPPSKQGREEIQPCIVEALLLLQKANWYCLVLSAVALLATHSKTKMGLKSLSL